MPVTVDDIPEPTTPRAVDSFDVMTSTTHTFLYKIRNWGDFAVMAKERMANLAKFIDYHIPEEKHFIWTSSSEMFRWMGLAVGMFYPTTIIPVEEWETFKPPVAKNLIYAGYSKKNPLMDWVKQGIIKKEDYILATTKTQEELDTYKSVRLIELWVNAQYHGFIKNHQTCDLYHYLSGGVLTDPDHTFTKLPKQCKCGYKSDTYSIV